MKKQWGSEDKQNRYDDVNDPDKYYHKFSCVGGRRSRDSIIRMSLLWACRDPGLVT